MNIKYIFFVLFFFSFSFAQFTDVSGTQSGTWTAANSPYRITGNVLVDVGSTLTIEPGVEVNFNGRYKIKVRGTISAIGTVTDSIVFKHFSADSFHYGIDVDTTSTTSFFTYCRIQDGAADDTLQSYPHTRFGGGILLNQSTAEIRHCTFKNNRAWYGGAIAVRSTIVSVAPVIEANFFEDNTATLHGGAIANWGGAGANIVRTDIINNIIVKNSSAVDNLQYGGGGISLYRQTEIDIINNTILNNHTFGRGGGLVLITSENSAAESMKAVVTNNLFWGNTQDRSSNTGSVQVDTVHFLGTADLTVTYSDLEGGFNGTGNIAVDPALADTANGDFSFSASSALVDAGINSGAPSTDFENNSRPFDGDRDQTETVDIGALEYLNTPPVLSAIPDDTINEDIFFSYQSIVTDPDVGDSIAYNLTAAPAFLMVSASGLISGTPANGDVGDNNVTLEVTDLNGVTDTQSFVLTVLNINDAPIVANPIADQQATEDVFYSFVFASDAFTDVDAGDNLTYGATLADDSLLPAWLNFTGSTRTFSGTPLNADVGTFTVKVTATDDSSASVSDEFDFEVTNSNDAPIVSNPIPDQTAVEDAAFNFTFASNTFTDPDEGDVLTYTATLTGGGALPGWLIFTGATRTFSGTPTNDDVGTLNIEVKATDQFPASVTDEFSLTINNTNDAPVVDNPIADQGATQDIGFDFTFGTGVFSDVDAGDNLAYSAMLSDNSALPAWLTFTPATRNFNGTPGNEDVGTISVKVTATDDSSASVSDEFDIVIVNENDPPVLDNPMADQSATEDVLYGFTFAANTFSDPDVGDVLTYSASLSDDSALPGWLTFTPATRTFSGTPLNDNVGIVTIKVTATDNFLASVSDEFTMTVNNTNDAPVVAIAIGDQVADEDELFTFTFDTSAFTDVDKGDSLRYNATLSNDTPLPSWLIFTAAMRTLSGTPTNEDVGTITVKVTATDDSTASVFDEFDIRVDNINDQPVLAELPNVSFAEDDSLIVPIENWFGFVTDPDNVDSTLVFIVSDGKFVISKTITGGFSFTAPQDWFGKDTLQVKVSDGELSDSVDYYIMVNSVNDAPEFTDLPEIVTMDDTSTVVLNLNDYVNDIDSPESSFTWDFSADNDSLLFDFNTESAQLTITSLEFGGNVNLGITVFDDSLDSASDTILVQVTLVTALGDELANIVPAKYSLEQNYPNPFNPTTKIRIGLPNAGKVKLEVFNILGQKVATVLDDFKTAGYHLIDFNASNLSSGVYFYRVQTKKFVKVRKMILMK